MKTFQIYLNPKQVQTKNQEGNDGPESLHWLIRKIPSYQTLQYLGIGPKNRTPKKAKLVAIVLIFSNKKILKDFTT